ncbi:MAG: precorrin-2 C(20)-methyltransferase [Chloroflexi bacterium]|nr:precorrin-2 C(20)-methyltransferase [Chloroflexota bacterium]MYE41052.1 precorrin-2 C(20)-methyltransferase [Chloroflexota bacterium]
MATPGVFYGVGVGPGDPELLTVRAQRLLEKVGVVCYTQLDNGAPSFALDVVRQLLSGGAEMLPITIPSDDSPVSHETWHEAASRIGVRLREGQDVAFITEGDPMLYSEFPHLIQHVQAEGIDGLSVEVVPGVPSVMAAAASSGVPLVSQGQRLAILPEVYGIDDLREAITNYDTIVLMEINPNLMRALANLESLGLAGHAIYVRQASTASERVIHDISKLTDEDYDYFSLLIIKR